MFVEYNSEIDEESLQDKRGVDFVNGLMIELLRMLGVPNAVAAKDKLYALMDTIGLKYRLSELNIAGNDIDIIVAHGFNPQRVKNNPRMIREHDLRSLLEKIAWTELKIY